MFLHRIIIVLPSHTAPDAVRHRLIDLLHTVVAKILLRVCWEAFRLHAQVGPCEGCALDWPAQRDHLCLGYPTRMDDDDVLTHHIARARQHLNTPAVLGVYLDLLRHLNLAPQRLEFSPLHLMEGILDEFEEDPLIVIPYSYGSPRDVAQFMVMRIANIRHFCNF